jgi:adenylate cyclase
MRIPFRSDLRLKPSILTSFLLLTLPVFATIIAVTYISNERIAREDARDLVERFRVDGIENVQGIFDAIKSLVRASATLGDQQPDFYLSNRSIKYFYSVLLHNEKMVSVYAGLANGEFRQARRIDPNVEIDGKLPPKGTKYAYRWIDLKEGEGSIDHYVFLDANGQGLGASQQLTAYDPRTRGWYRNTVAAGTTYITDPDVFSALGLIGFTVAAPFSADDEVKGVFAIDFTLDGLSSYLAERKISRGTVSYLLDHQGRVIAASDMSKTYTNKNGRLELTHISSLENELPAIAFGARPRQAAADRLYSFTHGGKEYFASLSTMPAEFGKEWQLFIITPVADFTGEFQQNNIRLLIFGLAATLVQIVIIYFLSGVISAPLEKLADNVGEIEKWGPDSPPSVSSQVQEIALLSRAVDRLDATVKSFGAFVPVGLVKELLVSDQKLRLGGHSRFLTIFFSDIEAFSTLSEEVPTQELMMRVSAHLEVLTKAVNEEHGTIDKFVGDGVMAFWGAPLPLEDHAWRACVAALRIQHGMDELNGRWIAEGLRPLNVRIGIHSDAVLVGNIGSKERMSYTVMGDGVNVAARLEGINKEFRTRICISHSTFREAGERLCVRPIDEVTVKGRRSSLTIYEVLGVFGAGARLEPTPDKVRLAELTRAAYASLIRDDKAAALDLYRKVLAEFPDDGVCRTLVERLAA